MDAWPAATVYFPWRPTGKPSQQVRGRIICLAYRSWRSPISPGIVIQMRENGALPRLDNCGQLVLVGWSATGNLTSGLPVIRPSAINRQRSVCLTAFPLSWNWFSNSPRRTVRCCIVLPRIREERIAKSNTSSMDVSKLGAPCPLRQSHFTLDTLEPLVATDPVVSVATTQGSHPFMLAN